MTNHAPVATDVCDLQEPAAPQPAGTDRWRMGFHLMPPCGWVNDPNGLCQFRGVYHVFHQYSPTWPQAHAERGWGHFSSPDLVHWTHHGMVVHQDIAADATGAYSGSALVVPGAAADGGDLLRLYYTGNVKEPGEHDYVRTGRQANQILMESPDGFALGEKDVLLTNADYPAFCSCHVRDPKLWVEDGATWMLLGARDLDGRGLALVMRSVDGLAWKYSHSVRAAEPFGFMWECPDRVELGGREWLSICPQGMADRPWAFGLRDVSGYLPLPAGARMRGARGAASGAGAADLVVDAADFELWDHGFEFYAPQTFVDERGRTLLIGWMGLPEAPYQSAPAGLDWIHCLTVVRELSVAGDGGLLQWPVAELESLREKPRKLVAGVPARFDEHRADLVFEGVEGAFELVLDGALAVRFDGNGTLELAFVDDRVAAGRNVRRASVDGVSGLRVLVDSSAVEVYANHGRTVFSTRWFPTADGLSVSWQGRCSASCGWAMHDCMAGTY